MEPGRFLPDDKRLHPRKKHIAAVDYQIMLSPQGTGIAKDISEGGLCMALERYLPPETLLKLRFCLPNDHTPIETAGKIIWTKKTEAGWLCGVQFMV